MKYLLLLLFAFTIVNVLAQEIPATTNNGKKVILNIKDKSWKYVNQNETDEICQQTKSGSLNVINNTNQDIYFFYGTATYYKPKNIKVKANSSFKINDIKAKDKQNFYNYKWKVSYELPASNINLGDIVGFQNGNFYIEVCSEKDIEIND